MSTKTCKCGGTMHHSEDMEDPFAGTNDHRPFWQCEDCGEVVDQDCDDCGQPTDTLATRVNHDGVTVHVCPTCDGMYEPEPR